MNGSDSSDRRAFPTVLTKGSYMVSPLARLSGLCGGGSLGAGTDRDDDANNRHSASSQWNGREQGKIYGDSDGAGGGEVDYVPPPGDPAGADDPERVPVLRGPWRKEKSQKKSAVLHFSTPHGPGDDDNTSDTEESWTRAVTPPRCDQCSTYLNPFCAPSAYTQTQAYDCNLCGARSSIVVPEEYVSDGTFNATTRCGTVEYEVGLAYCVRKEGPVRNVHLYGVEHVPPDRKGGGDGGDDNTTGRHHHHHHGSVRNHGWVEATGGRRWAGD